MRKFLVTARKFVPKFRNAFRSSLNSGGPFSCVESRIREWTVEAESMKHASHYWHNAKVNDIRAVRGYEMVSIEEIKE